MRLLELKTQESVERGKTEILADLAAGTVPVVKDFSELHDYVDANEYGGLCEDGHGLDHEEWLSWAAAVQDALDAWIKGGGVA